MLENVKQKINQVSYEIEANIKVLNKTRQDLKDTEDKINILTLASEVLKNIGDKKKQKTIEVFERVITSALQEVFGFSYKFVIDINSEGKRIITKFKLVNPDGNELSIMDSCGGGLVDCISFILRLLILVSVRPKRQRVIYLDEPFRHLSVDFRPKVVNLLKSITKTLDCQLVIVTHMQELVEADGIVSYELYKTEDGVKARRL